MCPGHPRAGQFACRGQSHGRDWVDVDISINSLDEALKIITPFGDVKAILDEGPHRVGDYFKVPRIMEE